MCMKILTLEKQKCFSVWVMLVMVDEGDVVEWS